MATVLTSSVNNTGTFLSMTSTWSCRYGSTYTINELIPNGWDCDTCMCACYLPTDDDEWVEEFLELYD